MTNLTDKFTAMDVHLAQRHQEVIVAINALLTALGAPPPEPGATLADVVGGLNQLHAQLATLQTALITQHMELKDTFTRNTQLLLIGLSALDPCKPCDVPSYQLPPIDATPVAVDQEHCKRVQALLYAILRFCVKLDVLSSLGTGFNPQIISAAFTEVITEINAAQSLTISLPSFGEILTLVASCVAFVASNIFAGNTLQGSFMSIQDSLIAPLYAATTAEAGMAAYRAGIDASDLPSAIKAVLKAAGYISLFNLYYGNTPMNLAGFDGTICVPQPPTECVTLNSVLVTQNPRPHPFEVLSQVQAILVPEWATATDTITFPGFAPYSYGSPIVWIGNYQGWTIRLLSGPLVKVYGLRPDGTAFSFSVAPGGTSPIEGTSQIIIAGNLDIGQSVDAFSIELCPPEPT